MILKDKKYRLGQVVKFRDDRHGEETIVYGKIIKCYYSDECECWRYFLESYPDTKSEYFWDVPENDLQNVALMEM